MRDSRVREVKAICMQIIRRSLCVRGGSGGKRASLDFKRAIRETRSREENISDFGN